MSFLSAFIINIIYIFFFPMTYKNCIDISNINSVSVEIKKREIYNIYEYGCENFILDSSLLLIYKL